MTKLLELAIEAVRRLPSGSQDDIARAMMNLASDDTPEEVNPDDLPHVLRGLEEAARGEFATDTEIEAALRRFGK